MKYMIYEDPVTHKFAFLPLPNRFDDGDALPAVVVDRWFDSHNEAVASLPDLFARDESEPEIRADAPVAVTGVAIRPDPQRPH